MADIFVPVGTLGSTQNDVHLQFRTRYTSLVSSPDSKITPFVLGYRLSGLQFLILYLLLPPTSSKFVFCLRYPLFFYMIYITIQTLRECKSPSVGSTYVMGVVSSWNLLWGTSLIIFGDARSEFKRIERRHRIQKERYQSASSEDGDIVSSGIERDGKQELRGRGERKDITNPSNNHQAAQEIGSEQNAPLSTSSPDISTYYVWQTLPPTFLHRLDWVFDLVLSFRGIGWSHQSSSLPPPPSSILSTLHPPFPPSSLPPSNPPTRSALFRRSLIFLGIYWIALDTLKYLALQDPYFLSLNSPVSLSPFPFPAFTRVALSLVSTYTGLLFIFNVLPLFVSILGPRILGVHADPWLYPPYFGPLSEISQKGLAGLWGNWWHQTFRYGFQSAGEFLAKAFGKGWGRNTGKGGALRLFTAFFLSGFMHACASYTSLPHTRPLNAFLFFALQPFGILIQRAAFLSLRRTGWRDRIPGWARGIGNVVFVVAWCCATGPIIADEFARSGIWLVEPVPISLWRGELWLWSSWVTWYSGGEWWWQRGLAV